MDNSIKYAMCLVGENYEVATYMALELIERSWFTGGAWHWADLAQCAASELGVILYFGNGERPDAAQARKQFDERDQDKCLLFRNPQLDPTIDTQEKYRERVLKHMSMPTRAVRGKADST